MPDIDLIAKTLERHDMASYGWSAEQFEIWWTKDSRSVSSRRKQRARARALVKAGFIKD